MPAFLQQEQAHFIKLCTSLRSNHLNFSFVHDVSNSPRGEGSKSRADWSFGKVKRLRTET